ncbi:unnamed protein product [Psylliodes chrysocephalus]|uniref:Uncharacterized protein n=1 Tax=Psylliodes chrysocephalus TaxID=3402493 RepID=A0A9P0DEA5_9CUCU|nr:unnamed protein product [Psylliodes chrysocephala]
MEAQELAGFVKLLADKNKEEEATAAKRKKKQRYPEAHWLKFLTMKKQIHRPNRVLKVDKNETRFISHKENYFGSYFKAVPPQKQKRKQKKSLGSTALKNLHNGQVPIKEAKVKDLLHLTQFLISPDAKSFYDALVADSQTKEDDSDIEFADDPPID